MKNTVRYICKWLPLVLLTAITGCRSARVQTIWQAESPRTYAKILVVAVLPGENDSLRSAIEAQAVQQLVSLGQPAVSYTDGFSIYGVAQATTQEAAYFTLCEKGIDAILTLAKCDRSLTTPLRRGTMVNYPASFYFNHIWNYRSIDSVAVKKDNFVWEAILFDLDILGQRSVLQVNNAKEGSDQEAIIQDIIGKMVKDKIIMREAAPFRSKAF